MHLSLDSSQFSLNCCGVFIRMHEHSAPVLGTFE